MPRMPAVVPWLLTLVLVGFGVWAAAVSLAALLQERLLFAPTPLAAEAPLAREPDVRETWVEADGARLSVLELRHTRPRGVVFFLHGNAGNLQTWFTELQVYRDTGFDLVMFDYRGYGKSTGRITGEAQLHADVDAVWQSVAARYRGLPVVGYGRSLGTALIAHWATRHAAEVTVTVLVSPYTSMAALARRHYPWIPVALLRYPLRTDAAVAAIRGPLVIVHGEADDLIPPQHARTLADIAPQAELLIVPGAGHGDIHGHGVYRDRMRRLLQDTAGPG